MEKLPVLRPDRSSYLKHRRDFTRQILVPIILVTLIGLGFAALSIYGAVGGSTGVSLWADISLIWLIIPIMFLSLVILGLVGALVYGMSKLLGVTPRYTGIVQQYALWINAEITLWSDKIIQPVLSLKAWLGIFSKREE
jgi:hypothetical protein